MVSDTGPAQISLDKSVQTNPVACTSLLCLEILEINSYFLQLTLSAQVLFAHGPAVSHPFTGTDGAFTYSANAMLTRVAWHVLSIFKEMTFIILRTQLRTFLWSKNTFMRERN